MPEDKQSGRHLIGLLEHPETMNKQELEDYAMNIAAIRDMTELQKSGARLVCAVTKDTTPEEIEAAEEKAARGIVNRMMVNGEFPGETEPLPESEQ